MIDFQRVGGRMSDLIDASQPYQMHFYFFALLAMLCLWVIRNAKGPAIQSDRPLRVVRVLRFGAHSCLIKPVLVTHVRGSRAGRTRSCSSGRATGTLSYESYYANCVAQISL